MTDLQPSASAERIADATASADPASPPSLGASSSPADNASLVDVAPPTPANTTPDAHQPPLPTQSTSSSASATPQHSHHQQAPPPPAPSHYEHTEIPAARIRSGLSDLERQSTQVLHRLQNIRIGAADAAAAAASLQNAAFLPAGHRGSGAIFGALEAMIADVSGSAHAAAVRRTPADQPTDAAGEQPSPGHGPPATDESDSDDDEARGAFALPALDNVAHLSLLTHTLAAYLASMEPGRLGRLTAKIGGDTQRWLAHMFRFIDATASYHANGADALLRAVRLALAVRCPGWLEGGVAAAAQPCLYAAEGQIAGAAGALHFVCRQLGLPLNAVRSVPMSATAALGGRMDVSAAQKLMAIDAAAGRTPLLLVAECGGALTGYVDDMARLQSVCRANGVWLHLRGNALAAIAIGGANGLAGGGGQSPPPGADSMHLPLGAWLALPNLPVALLHRPVQNAALAAFESDPHASRRLTALSLWTTLQALGRDTFGERLAHAFAACQQWYEICRQMRTVRILSKPLGPVDERPALRQLDSVGAAQLYDAAVTCVVFQFDGHAVRGTSDDGGAPATGGNPFDEPTTAECEQQLLVQRSMERMANAAYFDKLNMWLSQNMLRDCPDVDLMQLEHPVYGTSMRFCPFELALGQRVPDREQLERAGRLLEAHVDVLHATVKHRGTLQRLIAGNPLLRAVPLPDWAGLGGVRFVPDGWERLLTGDGRDELNRLNAELVETVHSTDSAFSMGVGPDGAVCVRFGMVTEDTDVAELLELVVSVGERVQENSKVLDTMAEIVIKGIETATADLQRESDEKLWSEGILRHVPVFGSMVNWWSPPPKETGIKGRSLNLTQGVVESTENIYKYHMQLSAHNQPIHGSKCPPAPLVQTSVGGHSRTVSQGGSSTASAAIVADAAQQQHTASGDYLAVIQPDVETATGGTTSTGQQQQR